MSDSADSHDEAAAPKAKNKLLPIVVIGNTLLLGGVAFLALKRPSAPAAAASAKEEGSGHEEKKEEKKEEHGEKEEHGGGEGEHGAAASAGFSARFEGLVVQVHAEDQDRYAHLTFEIETSSENDKKMVEARSSRIRDAVITYLSDRAEDDLRGSTGIQQMKETIVKRVDEIVPGKRARGIFITDFIIQ